MFPKSFQNLIDHFSSLPSVGPKMAERLVLFLFKQEKSKIEQFGKDLKAFANNLTFCQRCFHIAEGDLCDICKVDTIFKYVHDKVAERLNKESEDNNNA